MLKLGIDPEKLFRATFIRQYGLCCCNIALVSFRIFCKKIGTLARIFGANGLPPPPGKKFPVRLCLYQLVHAARDCFCNLYIVGKILTGAQILINVYCRVFFPRILIAAGHQPAADHILDPFEIFGSMVPWFDRHPWLQRCAVSGLLSCRACLSLRSNPPFCFALM